MKIIGMFFTDEDRTGLRLQQEIVDVGLPIKQTDAGITLANTLEAKMAILEQTMKENKRKRRHADEEELGQLSEEHRTLEDDLQKIKIMLKELKVNPLARFAQVVGFKKAPGVS